MDTPEVQERKTQGLSTTEALLKLHSEIEILVTSHENELTQARWQRFLLLVWDKSSCYTFVSYTCVIGMALSLLIAASMTDADRFSSGSRGWLITESLLLLASVVLNTILTGLRVKRQTGKHIGVKKNVMEWIKKAINPGWWGVESYPGLYSPVSPCVSLQWCVRDGQLVNLPHALLVDGDLIVMRPGHTAPGLCKDLEMKTSLQAGEMFVHEVAHGAGEGPQPRTPMSTKKFILTETPIITNWRFMLEEKQSKHLSFIENERNTVCNVWLEQRVLPTIFVVLLAVNVLRYFYVQPGAAHWVEILIVLQVHGILPLVPTLLPFLWTAVNTFGQAHIFSTFEKFQSLVDMTESSESLGSCSHISVEDAQMKLFCWETLRMFRDMFIGVRPLTCPDFEMLHALGSVTALCCVDKKGILSWPNPSAEKVFFFSSVPKQQPVEEEELKISNDEKKSSKRKKKLKSQQEHDPSSNIEVLDLTHDSTKDAFRVLFDDPQWKDHISALKPLGLSILLNTCSEQTFEWYSQFTDHVSCTARENKDTVAVVNRRCMCQLSAEIGFTDDAVNVFKHEATLGVYRQVPIEEAEREKQNRARSFIQHKIPMPNQVSVVVRDKLSGMCQLMTQGTGDLVLDCCSDAWTGTDLQVLSEMDRKRFLDFYHRNSMIAYCTAFAYKPLPQCLTDWSCDAYTELMENPKTTKLAHGEDVGVFLMDGEDEGELPHRKRSHSVDSLLDLSPTSSLEEVGVGKILQSHQTFVGMVSLQYQAKQDFVQMIDNLESACIRFVHFSKENEVRSRVFAEKMGLEAGWNCHVSLMASESVASTNSSCRNVSSLGQANCTEGAGEGIAKSGVGMGVSSPSSVSRTHSAPSFVNTEEVQVKFAKEPLPIVLDQEFGAEPDIFVSGNGKSPNSSPDKINESVALLGVVAGSSEDLNEEMIGEDGELEERKALISKCDDVGGENEEEEEDEEDFDVQSDSRYTSSYVTENTEDSLTGALDNRRAQHSEGRLTAGIPYWRAEFEGEAHLPRGIENIRPHLKNTDNVPLLVNLFTDCVPEATCEMIQIMQEYGEVVLVVGSSLNMHNTAIFMQADCSIAIEPLLPQLCAQHPTKSAAWNVGESSPTELASRLLSLPCPLLYQREDKIKLVQLIMESRHYIFAMRNCFYLMLCCLLAIVLAQLVGAILLLPPIMATHHNLWLVLVAVPALSLSLMGNPNEARTMGMATHRNVNHVNRQMIVEFFVQFCTRFLPSIIVALICFAVILYSFCTTTNPAQCSLYEFRSGNSSTPWTWTQKFQGGLVLAQNIFHLYFVLFLVAISASLVHWQDHLWQRCPFRNFVWTFTAGVLLLLQLIFSVADVSMRQTWFGHSLPLSQVHPSVWVVGCVWPVVTIFLNELAKRREIKLSVRRQRRARLDFDTKLGMNSPF